MTKWIKCSERLPENNREVLIYSKSDKEMLVGSYDDNSWSSIPKDWDWGIGSYPSHWAELPKPPDDE